MEINYIISKEELVNFHMKHVTETKNYKKATINNTIFTLLILFLVFIISKHSYYTITAFITCLVLLLFRKKIVLYLLRKKLYKILSFEKYTNYFEHTTLMIYEQGLKLTTNLSEKNYKWNSIKSLHLIDKFLLIKTNTHDNILIPIDSFKSLESKDFFINSIINNTNLKLQNKYPIDFNY
ncbi:hypothetical protein ACJDT4_16970 [Clostridium neuense]|uniref:YcxB-like protein domain-containing protein n=1 Tax=Clostridium neuense TaxID=1728934 RepID=A0ABW8TI21_9CLOT